jgi:Zn-dependent peptidase ImmA (M78 family)
VENSAYIYRPFELEIFVSNLYMKHRILYPYQIEEQYIDLGIELIYSRFRSYADESDGFKIINVNKQLDPIQKRKIFFHELGHLFLHGGDQRYGVKNVP